MTIALYMLILCKFLITKGYFTPLQLSQAIITIGFKNIYMNIRIYQRLLIGLVGLLLLSSAHAAEVTLTDLVDFQADVEQAQAQQLPVLILFSASYCSYCTVVKEEFLKPMLLSGDYTNKVIIRVLEIDSGNDIRDINGKQIDPEAIAERYNIYLTPTLVFVGPRGQELAQRMTGVMTIDFYGGYLDDAIDSSLAQLRSNLKLSNAN